MRTALLLGLVSLIAATSVACAVEDASGSTSALRRTHKTTDTTGDDDDTTTDGEPTVGEHNVDPGNPNATTTPNAPTTAGTASAKFAVALDSNTPTVDLGKDVELTVNITPTGAFNGSVTLAVTGLPAGATATPVTATLAGAATTAKLKISAGYNTPVTASVPLVITGTSGALTATANANFKVNPKVTLTIPMNVDALRAAGGQGFADEWGPAFGSTPTTLLTQTTNPIVVNVFNADSKPHVIHAGNDFGGHGDTGNPIQPNSSEGRTRTLKPGVKAVGYPHDGANGSSVSFHVNIGTAP